MCLNPKTIRKKGKYKESNYRGEKGAFYEINTFSKCGCCSQCLANKANDWVIRNYYEAKGTDKKCFITLTYRENPIFLVRKDLQDFIKRFRFEINKEYYKKYNNVKKFLSKEALEIWKEDHKNEFIKTRIFYAGEYGTAKGRSHFHVIIYGWEDENAKYLDINKKTNIIYQSEIIEKCWGLGRTSYQKFGDHEAPYIALYNTAQEDFKKSYKMTMEKAKAIQQKARGIITNDRQRQNLMTELVEIMKELETSKKKYLLIKEFNGWSQALGWKEFEKEYDKSSNYVFEEIIEGKAFATPSSWVKKLANSGDYKAAQEMYRREAEIIDSATEQEERTKNQNRMVSKRKQEVLDWAENGRINGEIDL